MKRLIAVVSLFSALVQVAAAKTFYVDPVNGQDAYDGSQAARGEGDVGPKRTLAHVGTLLADNDVIIAAPGHYAEGTTNVSGRVYRFYTDRQGVQLVSTDGAAATFIDGEPDTGVSQTSSPFGCGPNAVSCSALPKGGVIRGFTLANGHVQDGTSQYGGACWSSFNWKAALVDCVITNCYANRGGGVSFVDWLIRCKFINNVAVGNEGGAGVGGCGYVNCLFVGNEKYDVYASDRPAVFLNCTSINGTYGSFRRPTSGAPSRIYNSILIGSAQQNGAYTNCVFTAPDPTVNGNTTNGECRVVSAAELAYDGNYAPVRGNVAIDVGGEAYYDAVIAEIPAVIAVEAGLDVIRRPRVMGVAQDLGAYEYDWYADFSGALAFCNVTVTEADAAVSSDDRGVTLPSGSSLALDWALPSGAGATTTFRYSAVVTGTGVLKVYRGAAAEPTWLLTSQTGGEQSFDAAEGQSLRFEMTGDGSATLSRFSNSTVVKISDARGDLAVAGASLGVNEVPAGGSLTVSVTRKGASDRICFGLKINGVYRPFAYDDATDVWTVNLAAGDEDVVVEAVYAEASGIVVDPVNGDDDANDGTATFRAMKSLWKAADAAVSGQVVYALPGVHTNGYKTVGNENYRVDIKPGVKVVGIEGPQKTFILGAKSSAPVNEYGSGPGAVRGILISGQSTGEIIGFTISGCRCVSAGGYGAGISTGSRIYGAARNCIVTDCVSQRGGAINNLALAENCIFTGNRAMDRNGGTGVDLVKAVNCVFDGNYAAYEVYATADLDKTEYVNCTFGQNSEGAVHCNTAYAVTIRNSLVLSKSSGGCNYFNCIHGRDYVKEDSSSRGDADTKILPLADLALTSTWRPALPNHPAIDTGKDELYNGGEKDALGNARFVGPIDIGAVEYAGGGNWYVDAENGDDANDGRAPGAGHAKRTLAAAVAVAEVGDIVHAAPGIYAEGLMDPVNDITTNRVVVPSHIGLVADEGPDVTFIEGAPSALGTTGVGPGAVRCCYLRDSAYIRGFTLRGGYTEEGVTAAGDSNNGDTGGGIRSAAAGYSIDCVVSNCWAVRGGGIQGGSHFRCRTSGNGFAKYQVGNCAAMDVYNISAYDSVISGQNYEGGTFVNCTCLDKCWGVGPSFYNCYIGEDNSQPSMRTHFYNCRCRNAFNDNSIRDGDCKDGVAASFDAAGRPATADSALVDEGKAEFYEAYVPTGRAGMTDGLDVAGGQRVYNGTIDIGAGEYDWRGDFAKALKASRLAVSGATANVVEQEGTLVLSDGDKIQLVCDFRHEGVGSLETSLAGDGVLSVTFDGVAIEPVEGVYTFPPSIGSHVVDVSFAGEGTATLTRFRNPGIGMMLFVR